LQLTQNCMVANALLRFPLGVLQNVATIRKVSTPPLPGALSYVIQNAKEHACYFQKGARVRSGCEHMMVTNTKFELDCLDHA